MFNFIKLTSDIYVTKAIIFCMQLFYLNAVVIKIIYLKDILMSDPKLSRGITL